MKTKIKNILNCKNITHGQSLELASEFTRLEKEVERIEGLKNLYFRREYDGRKSIGKMSHEIRLALSRIGTSFNSENIKTDLKRALVDSTDKNLGGE